MYIIDSSLLSIGYIELVSECSLDKEYMYIWGEAYVDFSRKLWKIMRSR